MLSICVFLMIMFRWWALEPILGAKRMYLLDAILFTIGAAMMFASPGEWPTLSYIIGGGCIYIVLHSSLRFMRFDEQGKGPNTWKL